ncbi:hypothetical protein ACFQ1E_04755 [Sphingomonas canadensis]|uniref:Uncharacterized protein n=1 Tax=Sphingomonas canadensis TaxID=1219257 RepID=A0ABW3H4Q3_9SPHN|nr:hypothetical protein [Sphingomonas canadensis]MCW3834450.1 hypothetical protein [Sphingomonas canadensis]
MPFFVPITQCEGVDTGPIVMEAPASQDRMAQRLSQIMWKVEAGALPPCLIIGLADGNETHADAIERAGDGADPRTFRLQPSRDTPRPASCAPGAPPDGKSG